MKFRVATAWVSLVAFMLSACATTGQRPASGREDAPESRAACIAKYTAGGAGTGLAIGLAGMAAKMLIKGKKSINPAQAGKKIIGTTLVGGTIGFAIAWGKCLSSYSEVKSTSAKDYGSAASDIEYRPEKGLVVSIRDYALQPGAVKPSGEITFKANYYVMDVPQRIDIVVTETRIVQVWDKEKQGFVDLGRVPEEVPVDPGMRSADGHITIPEEMPLGKYKLGFEVSVAKSAGGVEKAIEWMTFEVTADRTKLAKAQEEAKQMSISVQSVAGRGTVSQTSAADNKNPARVGSKDPDAGKTKMLRVGCDRLAVREKPDRTTRPIGQVNKEELYPVLEDRLVRNEQWYRIDLDNGTGGWVLGTYARIEE